MKKLEAISSAEKFLRLESIAGLSHCLQGTGWESEQLAPSHKELVLSY